MTMLSLCPFIPYISFCMSEPIFMKYCMYIMSHGPISKPFFINPSHQSMSVCVSSLIANLRLGKITPVLKRQRSSNTSNNIMIVGLYVLYAVRVVSRKTNNNISNRS
jgi:hypothetical protein